MRHRTTVTGIVLIATIALAGCAGKVRVTSAKSCAAHGGTYNAAAKSCTYAATTRTAKQSCEMNGGFYDTDADVCEYNP